MEQQMDLDATPVWERNMNPEQLAAIRHQDGPLALLAQAGSGKTRALVHRIARMVAEGTRPSKILAVTFSKKAADEMNERLDQLGVEGARVGTWHSLCLEILREEGYEDWKIDEGGRAGMILKDVLGYRAMDWRGADAGEVERFIGWCKAHGERADSKFAADLATERYVVMGDAANYLQAYRLYQKQVEAEKLLTFDDFLLFAYEVLSIEANRQKWAARWKYLLQDEAQDANLVQVRIAELLARDHRNYLVVGDVAQAIYGFRGSSPLHLHNFAGAWQAETVVMNRNYRSGRAIVDVANKVIAPAAVRLPTDMLGERDAEGSVAVRACDDLDDEGAELAEWAKNLAQTGAKLSDVCVLYRTNAQSRAVEEALLNKRIAYVVIGGTSFYERKEVKDLLAYLRVAAGRDNDGEESLRRSINAPFRFLGKAFVDKVLRARGTLDQRIRQACNEAGVQYRQRQSAEMYSTLVATIQVQMQQAGIEGRDASKSKPHNILTHLVDTTRYIDWLEKESGSEGTENSRGANVREMVRIAERFDTVGELLDYVDEMQAAAKRKMRGDKGERVTLMSIHRSKGLEWPHVWVCGCNELVLPHGMGDLEEERRLMYVAVTRARDELVLSYVRKFAYREGVRDAFPSCFLRDAGLLGSMQDVARAAGAMDLIADGQS
jgi:DNA helicase-2/ATP-dependent DNA helicase PcrA